MRLKVKFNEIEHRLKTNFGEIYNVSDGGYEQGYEAGYLEGNTKGYTEGYNTGYGKGLAERTYETWVITLTDGTLVEKEVTLL